MSVYEYIIGVVLIVLSLLVVAVILLQQGRQANMGVISGGSDSFLDKGAAKTWDMRLARFTKILAIVFFVLVFSGMLITKFLNVEALAKNEAAGTPTTSTTTTTTTAAATTTTTTAASK